jgi:hypothetical protein
MKASGDERTVKGIRALNLGPAALSCDTVRALHGALGLRAKEIYLLCRLGLVLCR